MVRQIKAFIVRQDYIFCSSTFLSIFDILLPFWSTHSFVCEHQVRL